MSTSLHSIQATKILKHMTEKGSITPVEALQEYNCMRLAARIYDLRKLGSIIEAQMVHTGEVHIAQYSMKGK